ncbi:ParB/RepB/Spo0J family partition protein [Hyalangium gracile]|uniref:ParB/RepB/Spo0J family partition protein n=1 Tax=Hyalangium gracile TaxID=394092 RepID=UPI001CCFFEC3|nr:ParB N-terminal domain-containing protein [Hyalangium gracile]
MDAENRVDGEDGKPDEPGESPSAPGEGEGVPPRSDAPAAEQPAGKAILLGAGEPLPETAAAGADQPDAASEPGSGADAGEAVEESPEESSDESSDEAAQAAAELPPRPASESILAALPLEQIDEDTTFRIRPEGEISKLATDVARLGQLFPVDVRPAGDNRYQIICGFRRVAALRFLKRDRVQVRIHTGLPDEDALLMALASAIHAHPVEREQLEATRDQLEAEGRLSAATRDMLEKALATDDSLAPESMEEEVDADELAADAAQRLGALNQDLSLLADVFTSLDEARRAELLMQLRYSAELVAYLEGL